MKTKIILILIAIVVLLASLLWSRKGAPQKPVPPPMANPLKLDPSAPKFPQ